MRLIWLSFLTALLLIATGCEFTLHMALNIAAYFCTWKLIDVGCSSKVMLQIVLTSRLELLLQRTVDVID